MSCEVKEGSLSHNESNFNSLPTEGKSVSRIIDEFLNQAAAIRRLMEPPMAVVSVLEAAQRQQEVYDAALGGRSVRDAEERYLKDQRALIAPLSALSFQQSEIAEAVEQLRKPWKDLEFQTNALLKSHLDTKRAIDEMLPRNVFPAFVGEWERALQALAKPEWMRFADELASRSGGIGALELLDELADFAYENRSEATEVVPEKDEGRWKRLTVWEWIAILSFLIAIAQAVRSEYIASESDRKGVESEKRIQGAITTAQTLLLEEIRREYARRSNQRWVVLERPVWMTLLPEAGSKRIVRLRPGEVLVESDHHTKWIQVEVTIDGRVLSGWILKKYAERRRGTQEVSDNDN